jgi:ribosome recycling factor
MLKEILSEAKTNLKEVEENYKKEISKLRTGRASTSILDEIMVDYYGTSTPINQMATISVPEGNLIVIQPWDMKIIADIESALRNSNIGINPVSDGKLIRLPVPPLDEQRRKDIIKTLNKYTEERKTAVRNQRREYRELVKAMKDDKEISEDEEKRFYDELQKIVDSSVNTLETINKEKEKSILDD